jgi:RHS repeat-associated protein
MAVLDMWGNIVERYSYDAFGKAKIMSWWDNNERSTSWINNRFMFQGREWIAELGIYDYRHRMYSPELGRFLQTDPTGFDAGDMNLFRYCGEDPVDGSDPMGLQDEVLSKPNLISSGQGDWMRPGSPFTKGDMLRKAQDYVREISFAVKQAVDKANKNSRNVTWSASFSNSIKSREFFKGSRTIATTTWSPNATAVMDAGAVARFNVNLQVNINWNENRIDSWGSALSTGVWGLGKTGEIEHSRDALRALTSPYGGVRPAVEIANEQAASMVGQSIPEGTASSQMNTALSSWAAATMNQSHKDHDVWGVPGGGDHVY